MLSPDRNAKLGVLDGLIKYMRQLELAKDEPKDALGDGLGHVEGDMKDKSERDLEDGKPEVELEIESPKEEMDEKENGGEDDEEQMSPLKKEMSDYFNNRDKPKIGSSMTFMVESKKPLGKMGKMAPKMDPGMDAMDMAMMKKKGRGRPRRG